MKIDQHRIRTDISLIDNHHESYLDLVDSLFELCNVPHPNKKKVDQAIRELNAYAIEHFDAEEALMRSVNYPGLDAHTAKHDEFRDKLDLVCQSSCETINQEHLLVQLTKWMLEWFCEQVQTYDRALASHLKKQARLSPKK